MFGEKGSVNINNTHGVYILDSGECKHSNKRTVMASINTKSANKKGLGVLEIYKNTTVYH